MGSQSRALPGWSPRTFPGLLVISHLSRILGGALVASTVRPYCKSASVQSFHTGFLGKCMWVTHNDGGSRMSNPNLIPTVIGNNHSLWELVVHDEYREAGAHTRRAEHAVIQVRLNAYDLYHWKMIDKIENLLSCIHYTRLHEHTLVRR